MLGTPVKPDQNDLYCLINDIKQCINDHSQLLHSRITSGCQDSTLPLPNKTSHPIKGWQWYQDQMRCHQNKSPSSFQPVLIEDPLLNVIYSGDNVPPTGTAWANSASAQWGYDVVSKDSGLGPLPPPDQARCQLLITEEDRRHPIRELYRALMLGFSMKLVGIGSKYHTLDYLREQLIQDEFEKEASSDRSKVRRSSIRILSEIKRGTMFSSMDTVMDHLLFLALRCKAQIEERCLCGGRTRTRTNKESLKDADPRELFGRRFLKYDCSFCKGLTESIRKVRSEEKMKTIENTLSDIKTVLELTTTPQIVLFLDVMEGMNLDERDFLLTLGCHYRSKVSGGPLVQIVVGCNSHSFVDRSTHYCPYATNTTTNRVPPMLTFLSHSDVLLPASEFVEILDDSKTSIPNWHIKLAREKASQSMDESDLSADDSDSTSTGYSEGVSAPSMKITSMMRDTALRNLNDPENDTILGVIEDLASVKEHLYCRCKPKPCDSVSRCPVPFVQEAKLLHALKDEGIHRAGFLLKVKQLVNEGVVVSQDDKFYRVVEVIEE